MKTKLLAILNTISLALLILISSLTQQNWFSDLNVGEVSSKYETVFAPAPITFAIWGLIYASLAAFCVFHIIKAFNNDRNEQANTDIVAIGWLFIINNLATAAWLVAWVNELIGLSVILILIQLFTLVLISVRAHIANPDRDLTIKIFTQFPLSIYFAWICVATIANISAFLVSINWDGFGISGSYWTIIMIGVTTMLSLFIILVRRNFFFGLVILWALYGIALKRGQVDEIAFQEITNAVWAAFIIILVTLLMRLLRTNKLTTQLSRP
ncbi:hypothetical protein [Daejeonella sp.]|uniref:hypothetical protein n=1 Tax=Daejeonella sp. TaxID=2805397 RepID=UPI003983CB01